MDCEAREEAFQAAIDLAMERPKWRLSLQAHKVVGLADEHYSAELEEVFAAGFGGGE